MNKNLATMTSFAPKRLGKRAAPLMATVLGLLLADCSAPTPKGQVVAVVNGQEVTVQDINSEAIAEGPRRTSDPKVLLQKVIARVLFAQQAHTLGLDQYAGYPADQNRIKQTFLAQKAASKLVTPPPPPTPAQIQAFIDQHPTIFKDRSRISVDEISFDPSVNANMLQTESTLSGLASRLKSIDAQFQQQSRVLDTADLPPQFDQKLESQPLGVMFYIRTPTAVVAMVVKEKLPVQALGQEQTQLAQNLMAEQAAQKASEAVFQRLKAQAHITYQPNFAPTAKPASPAPAPTAKPNG
jgi:EpsD family peptidyl-prolyl cis-trans isomerase